jgi:hypothetical protein
MIPGRLINSSNVLKNFNILYIMITKVRILKGTTTTSVMMNDLSSRIRTMIAFSVLSDMSERI